MITHRPGPSGARPLFGGVFPGSLQPSGDGFCWSHERATAACPGPSPALRRGMRAVQPSRAVHVALGSARASQILPASGPVRTGIPAGCRPPDRGFLDDCVCAGTGHRGDRPDFRLRTEGIVAAMCACGGWGTFVGGVIGLMPNRFGNGCYELVARMRYHMFGPWRACPLPNPEWAKRFID